MSQTLHCVKKLDYLCNWKSEISNVCNAMEGHCLQAMKIVHHYANSCFDWLFSGHLSINLSREAISILSGNYKRFTFVHPVHMVSIQSSNEFKVLMVIFFTKCISLLANDYQFLYYVLKQCLSGLELISKRISYKYTYIYSSYIIFTHCSYIITPSLLSLECKREYNN